MNNNRNLLISEDKKVSNIINQIPNNLNLIQKMQVKFDDMIDTYLTKILLQKLTYSIFNF